MKLSKDKTFTVPFAFEEVKENLTVNTNTPTKEEIINQAFKLLSQGKILDAEKHYQYYINKGVNNHIVFCNYGIILKDLGKLKRAELSMRQAIEMKSNFAEAHNNLGSILKEIGKLQEAELSIRKAIQLKPN